MSRASKLPAMAWQDLTLYHFLNSIFLLSFVLSLWSKHYDQACFQHKALEMLLLLPATYVPQAHGTASLWIFMFQWAPSQIANLLWIKTTTSPESHCLILSPVQHSTAWFCTILLWQFVLTVGMFAISFQNDSPWKVRVQSFVTTVVLVLLLTT